MIIQQFCVIVYRKKVFFSATKSEFLREDSIREVAGYYGMSESKVKSMLYRTRIGLKKYLEQEGFFDET